MTQESEKKIYNALMEFREEQAVFNTRLQAEFLHMKQNVDKSTATLSEHEAIKERAVGAMWLSALIGSSGILAWIYSLFIKNH